MENSQAGGSKKPWIAFNIAARNGKKHWNRVGAAWPCSDGSWNVILDSLPIDGKLNIREDRERPWESRGNGQLAQSAEAEA